jgi:hypothetical protein
MRANFLLTNSILLSKNCGTEENDTQILFCVKVVIKSRLCIQKLEAVFTFFDEDYITLVKLTEK